MVRERAVRAQGVTCQNTAAQCVCARFGPSAAMLAGFLDEQLPKRPPVDDRNALACDNRRMTSLPWEYPVEPEGGWPLGQQRETITVDAAPDGHVAICVGPYDGFLPPDKVEEFIAAVRAAAAEAPTVDAVEPEGERPGPVVMVDTTTKFERQVAEMAEPIETGSASREGDRLLAAARAGYKRAIAVLRDVAHRIGSPAAQWAADYLTADPDQRAPGAGPRGKL